MKKNTVKLTSVLLFIGLFSFFAFGQTNSLFSLKDEPKANLDKSSPASIREAEISFNFSTMTKLNSQDLSFPLFDGKNYSAKMSDSEGFEFRSMNDFTWRGKLTEGNGDVVLTFKKGYVAGLIYTLNSVYEIVPKGDKQILIELNTDKFPECSGDLKNEETRENKLQIPSAGVDSGDRVDVLVLYTTPVKNTLGGVAQAQAFAQQAIDSANTAYINSKIRMRIRLAAAEETAIAETGSLGTELPVLRNDPATAISRNTSNADLVAMISNSADNCGIGYLMGGTTGNQNNGFTVTSRTCAVGNLSFAHELGHNMGSQHNPENGSNPSFNYGFGHYYDGNYRTVMSYVNPCPSGCTRRAYFSNPQVVFNNLPTGIEDARDNARSINNTADNIANYRYSGSSISLLNFNGGNIFQVNLPRKITWSSDNVSGNVSIEYSKNGGSSWITLLANTPNDGEEIIKIPFDQGRSRSGRLRVSSATTPYISDSSVNNFQVR
jgi:peptidyl-Asp metalloendopeptidase